MLTPLNLFNIFRIKKRQKLAQKYFDAAYELGVKEKRYKDAIQCLNKVIELNPKRTQAYDYRGSLYYHSGQFDEAISDLIKINDINQLNPDDYALNCWMIGECYIGLGLYQEAMSYFNESIKYDPFLSLPYSGRGYVYLKKGDLTPAIDDLNKAIELDSNNAMAYYYRSEYYLTIGEINLATTDLTIAIKKLAYHDYLQKEAELKLKNIENHKYSGE